MIATVIGVAVAAAFLVWTLPDRVQGSGSLDECSNYEWPVVILDGGEDSYLPVISWPAGLRYDEEGDVLRDTADGVVLRRRDRVTLSGSIVDVHGDPSPCYYTRGIRLYSIESEPGG
ncbi:MAG TPA: hypothetical protein VFH90_04070 [Candidatus Limnocylindria bacterium]|nr:hypothetical protein [Candidatus Limnocylindria bacterium]